MRPALECLIAVLFVCVVAWQARNEGLSSGYMQGYQTGYEAHRHLEDQRIATMRQIGVCRYAKLATSYYGCGH